MKPRVLFIAGEAFHVPADVHAKVEILRPRQRFAGVPDRLPDPCHAVLICVKLCSHGQYEAAHKLAMKQGVLFLKANSVSGLRAAVAQVVQQENQRCQSQRPFSPQNLQTSGSSGARRLMGFNPAGR